MLLPVFLLMLLLTHLSMLLLTLLLKFQIMFCVPGTSLPRMYSRVKDRNTGRYPLLPTPRYVSRQMLLPDDGDDKHLPDISNLFMQWGQFTDHDMTGTPVSKGTGRNYSLCCEYSPCCILKKAKLHASVFKFSIYSYFNIIVVCTENNKNTRNSTDTGW